MSLELLNKRFGLRQLLQNSTYHTSDTAIPKTELIAEKEPRIREQIVAFAAALVANPAALLVDEYTPVERRKDWESLVKKEVLVGGEILAIDARSRPGHKLLDHYMPHFYEVANYRGASVRSLITQEAIEKALLANLAMHSTPYKSEIRRMLVLTGGLSNVTKYRTVTAKAIVSHFGARRVLDPCIGWGGRMLGTLAVGAEYVGCEPDPQTAAGLRAILGDPAIPTSTSSRALVLDAPVEESWAKLRRSEPYDMVLTSPPYFNLELYVGGPQSVGRHGTWATWVLNWLQPTVLGCLALLREGGTSCWSVKNFRTDAWYPLADEVARIHKEAGWMPVKTVAMRGSGRPGAGRVKEGKETRESEEETFCYQLASASTSTAANTAANTAAEQHKEREVREIVGNGGKSAATQRNHHNLEKTHGRPGSSL
jgi:hypothetical protein